MQRVLILAAVIAGVALAVPQLVDGSLLGSTPEKKSGDTRPARAPAAAADETSPAAYTGRGRVVLRADARGHYEGTFRINGRRIKGMIDTGASVIAINRSTARKLGIGVAESDFKYRVATANGTIPAARVVLRSVEIQSIRVGNVEALVVDDRSLGLTLIGMSFLNKIASYRASNGELILTP